MLQQTGRERHGVGAVAHKDRDDGGAGLADLVPEPGKGLGQAGSGGHDARSTLRLRRDDPHGLDGCAHRGGRRGGVIDVAAGPVAEPLDEVPGSGDEPAGRAKRFGQGRHHDAGPGLGRLQEAGGVGIVDHQHRPVPFAGAGDVRHRRKVALHREDGVGHHEPAAGVDRAECPFQVGHVGVPVDGDPGPREPAPVDDARMVQLVREDGVLPSGQRRDRAGVGQVAGREDDRVLASLQPGQRRLQAPVRFAGARHEPGGAAARTPPSGGGRSRPAKARIGGETQVVVGAELDHPPAPHDDLRPLGARERDGVPAQTLALEPGELPGAPRQGISHNGSLRRWRPG